MLLFPRTTRFSMDHHTSDLLLSPTQMLSSLQTKDTFVSGHRPREPALRIWHRPPSFDFHPSQSRMVKRRRAVRYSPSPLSNLCSVRNGSEADRVLAEIITLHRYNNAKTSTLSASSLSTSSSLASKSRGVSRYSKSSTKHEEYWQGNTDPTDEEGYHHRGCLDLTIVDLISGLSPSLKRTSKRTPNILLKKKYYNPQNLPPPL